jgi:DMATS type aromatic prenyltransferase
MTDNHVPIELSWDWRTDGKPPKIRFSIEPVGVHAGTHLDPRNQYAATRLRETVARVLPNTDMEWLDHFQSQLNGKAVQEIAETVEGHMSKEFYAFDLNDNGSIMAKAYFFPGFKATTAGKSNFDIIRTTISTAPGCSPDKLESLACFQSYVRDPSTPRLEMDMLAIDLVGPVESRFKIYFRIRDTSFASIRNTMTLGGRIQTPDNDQALVDLRRLYFTLVGTATNADESQMQMVEEDLHPQDKDHRTAGILYNVEFKYGSKSPKIKVYLPVRHFALSEEGIVSALDAHFQQTQRSCSWRTNMSNYREALRTVL